MAKRFYDESSYSNEQAARTQAMQDAGMIKEDRSAVANMPQSIVYKDYPKNNNYLDADLDDSIAGIDNQMSNLDGGVLRRIKKPKKV